MISERKAAKNVGLRHYFTGKPCKHGHTDTRLVSTGQCCECVRLNHYKDYPKHKEKRLQCIKGWQQMNKEKVNSQTRQWRSDNPDKASQVTKQYYHKNKDTKLINNREWRQNNKPKVQYYNALRRAQIAQATTLWADMEEIQQIYEQATELTTETGIPYHVDHIVPLFGKTVCGLHVEYNLQIITATENFSKGNKLI